MMNIVNNKLMCRKEIGTINGSFFGVDIICKQALPILTESQPRHSTTSKKFIEPKGRLHRITPEMERLQIYAFTAWLDHTPYVSIFPVQNTLGRRFLHLPRASANYGSSVSVASALARTAAGVKSIG